MIETLIEDIGRCRSDREFFKIHMEAERVLAPLELQALLDQASRLPKATRNWLQRTTDITRFSETPPKRYRRQEIAPNIVLYGDPQVDRSAKRLILCFCGSGQRLLLPIANMLQFLPSRQCDVVVLRDPTLRHFLCGIAPYSDDFLGLSKRLAADLPIGRYAGFYTYGTCLGGFAALRAGMLLGAGRSIAVNGIFPWHIRRLTVEPENELPAFDPLCMCCRRGKTELVCAYSLDHEKNREQAARLARILPVEQIAMPGLGTTNLIHELAKKNALGTFFNVIFDLTPEKSAGNPVGTRKGQAEPRGTLLYQISARQAVSTAPINAGHVAQA